MKLSKSLKKLLCAGLALVSVAGIAGSINGASANSNADRMALKRAYITRTYNYLYAYDHNRNPSYLRTAERAFKGFESYDKGHQKRDNFTYREISNGDYIFDGANLYFDRIGHKKVNHRRYRRIRRQSRRSIWTSKAPRAIQGYWMTRHHHHQVWGLTFLNSSVAFNPSGAAISNWSHPIYKRYGNTYLIRTTRRSRNSAGRVSGENYVIKAKRRNIYVWTNGRYIGNYHKSSKRALFGY